MRFFRIVIDLCRTVRVCVKMRKRRGELRFDAGGMAGKRLGVRDASRDATVEDPSEVWQKAVCKAAGAQSNVSTR